MRTSRSLAETSTPVRWGRVSSRDAARATRAIVSTKAVPGTVSTPDFGASGRFGKSSTGSVRRWNRAGPETTSTSCCALRYSSVTSSFGSERTTSSKSRPGTTAVPSAESDASRPTRIPSSMSVARSSTRPSATWIRTPASVWMALRVETPRTAMPSRVSSVSRETVSFNEDFLNLLGE